MGNNSTNINKANNHLSPQIIKHKKDHDIRCWKSSSWFVIFNNLWIKRTKFGHLYIGTDKKAAYGEVYLIQRYVIKFVSDLWQVHGVLHQ